MTPHNDAFVWLSFVFLLLFPISSFAQSFFQLNEQDNQLHFSYHWDDFDGNQNTIEFSADKNDFLAPLKRYRGFNLERSQRELSRQLNRYIRQQQWRGIQAKLTPRQQSVELITSKARSREQQAQLEQYKQRLREYYNERWVDYLDSNFYETISLPPGQQGIIPDHAAIAGEMASVIKPLINAIGEQLGNNTQRNYINYVTSFLQHIPYNDLSSKLDSRGDGFVPPNQLIYYNQGDCDSKVTLMTAIMRNIINNAQMAIIYLPDHAVFGINMSKRDSDTTIEHDGIQYVLVDVTGPAAMPAGTVSEETEFHIHTGQYTVKPVN
ncbi:hypothetical protein [Idiomarina sp. X4]|uniref:hypothetical protein n=1 Tax=Idiomarina sp. X4 TaxID=2055892 RepID=UPI001E61FB0F|nr:hypothetical protein [Idiomarina sp. X4]